MRTLRPRSFVPALCGILLTGSIACDWNDPDEIQNSANLAVIRAQFFESRANRVPVPGVRMLVEAPEDSERPYNGPDVVAVSGEDGVAIVRIFPGLDDEEEAGGGTGGEVTGPQNPLELPPPLVFADVAIVLIYRGDIVSFIGTGLTVGSGRLYDLGAVFLDEFGLVAD